MNWFGPAKEYYGEKWFSSMELAYPLQFRRFHSEASSATLVKHSPSPHQVAIVISGGGSDGPLLPGFVGEGLADACVVGAPYSAPNAYAIYEVSKELGKKQGVLLMFNNFMGDFLNNDMAAELLRLENYQVEALAINDDMGTALGEPKENRGGRCALPLMVKIAAGAAKEGKSLKEVTTLVKKASERVSTVSLVVDTEKNSVSFGNGFSGEQGFYHLENTTPQQTAEETVKLLISDIHPRPDEKLFLLVNRLRMTSYADSYIMAGYLHHAFSRDYQVTQMRVGAFSNILDVYGYTVTVLCADAEIASYLEGYIHSDSFLL